MNDELSNQGRILEFCCLVLEVRTASGIDENRRQFS